MTKYGIITPDEGPRSFVQGVVLPARAVEVSAPEWLAAIDEARSPTPDLVTLKEQLKGAIDAAAEAQRLKYITPGAGQAMTYSRKVEEARAVQSADEPEADDYPLLAASIGIDGDDIEAVAATVLAMDAAWALTGAAIERARLLAKRDVDAAADADTARAVSPSWP